MCVVNDCQDNWNVHLPHIGFAYNNSLSVVTGLAPNRIRLGHLPRFPIVILEQGHIPGNQSLQRYQRAYDLVREYNTITTSCITRPKAKLLDAFHKCPLYKIGDWVWLVYSADAAIRQNSSKRMYDLLLSSKISLNWTGPFLRSCKLAHPPPLPTGIL